MGIRRLVMLGGVLSLAAPGVWPADASGLDVTIEVLGRNDRVDERIVNRIVVPGVGVAQGESSKAPLPPLQGLGAAVGGTVKGVTGLVDGVVGGVVEGVAPLVPLLRYDEWVQQRREAEQERQRESRDRPR
jgi:hypothetical protein